MRPSRRKKAVFFVLAAVVICTGCIGDKYKPSLFMSLPEKCNTPDGMTLDEDGNAILSCPNFNNKAYAARLMKIDKDDNLSEFSELPEHPDSKRCGPMGLDFGPDGNLYVADNQYFFDKDHASRLVRVKVENGKAVGFDVAVDGFKLANAVIWHGDSVYVSDTFFDLPDKPGKSGIYRIKLSEMQKGTVHLKPNATDRRLIATFTTVPNHRDDLGGADGLTFDSKGNLYTGNFGDGVISKITFDENGEVASNEIIVKDDRMPCADGIFCDLETDNVYITDSENNAIHVLSPDGELTTIWENGDTDGSDGLLDQPCEPLIRDGELLVVCFDMPFPGLKNSEFDEHHTISVIDLDK